MAVQVTNTVKIAGGSVTLDDLREFTKRCMNFPGDLKVNITASHDVREGSYYTIYVTGTPKGE